jgi:hypothetical protein
MAGVPAAAEGADEFYAGGESAASQRGLGALVLDERGFGGEDFEIVCGAAFVAFFGDGERAFGVFDGGALGDFFLFEDAQVAEFVFDFVEGEEDDAFVVGGAGFEEVAGLLVVALRLPPSMSSSVACAPRDQRALGP